MSEKYLTKSRTAGEQKRIEEEEERQREENEKRKREEQKRRVEEEEKRKKEEDEKASQLLVQQLQADNAMASSMQDQLDREGNN